MVVMIVIAILVGITIPRFKGMQDEANISKVQSELKTLQIAVESYRAHQDVPEYPNETTTLVETYLSGAVPQVVAAPLYDPFNEEGDAEYMFHVSDNGAYYVISSCGPDRVCSIEGIQDTAGNMDTSEGDPDDIFVTNGSGNFGA